MSGCGQRSARAAIQSRVIPLTNRARGVSNVDGRCCHDRANALASRRHRRNRRGRGRWLRAAVTTTNRMLTTSECAELYGRSPAWYRDHAAKLGAERPADGAKPRLMFNQRKLEERLNACSGSSRSNTEENRTTKPRTPRSANELKWHRIQSAANSRQMKAPVRHEVSRRGRAGRRPIYASCSPESLRSAGPSARHYERLKPPAQGHARSSIAPPRTAGLQPRASAWLHSDLTMACIFLYTPQDAVGQRPQGTVVARKATGAIVERPLKQGMTYAIRFQVPGYGTPVRDAGLRH